MRVVEIDFLKPLIEKYFKDTIEKNKFELSMLSKTEFQLKSPNYTIVIYGEGWHGHQLYLKFIDHKTLKEYTDDWFIKKAGFQSPWGVFFYSKGLLPKEEREFLKSLENQYEKEIVEFSYLVKYLEKYIIEEFGLS